jgi:hypothetical protein
MKNLEAESQWSDRRHQNAGNLMLVIGHDGDNITASHLVNVLILLPTLSLLFSTLRRCALRYLNYSLPISSRKSIS